MDRQPPDDDAYGRVTNPERFLPLHAAARAVADELARTYDVTRVDEGDRIRLAPADTGAATIELELTAFPAVHVRCGRWFDAPLPQCGCDACDEHADDQIAELHRLVGAVVSGGLHESYDGVRLAHALRYPDGGRSSGWSLIEGRDLGPTGSHDWRPWPLATG